MNSSQKSLLKHRQSSAKNIYNYSYSKKGKIRKSKGYNKEREQQQSYKLSISLGGNTIVHVASE